MSEPEYVSFNEVVDVLEKRREQEAVLVAVFSRLLLEGDYTDLFGVEGHRTLVIDSGIRLSEDEYAALKAAIESAA